MTTLTGLGEVLAILENTSVLIGLDGYNDSAKLLLEAKDRIAAHARDIAKQQEIIREYVEAKDAFMDAARPFSHGPTQLKHSDPIRLRYYAASRALAESVK